MRGFRVRTVALRRVARRTSDHLHDTGRQHTYCSLAAGTLNGYANIPGSQRMQTHFGLLPHVPLPLPVVFIGRSSPEDVVAGPGMAVLPCHR